MSWKCPCPYCNAVNRCHSQHDNGPTWGESYVNSTGIPPIVSARAWRVYTGAPGWTWHTDEGQQLVTELPSPALSVYLTTSRLPAIRLYFSFLVLHLGTNAEDVSEQASETALTAVWKTGWKKKGLARRRDVWVRYCWKCCHGSAVTTAQFGFQQQY